MRQSRPERQPYPDFDFNVALIRAHAEGLQPQDRHLYLEYLTKKKNPLYEPEPYPDYAFDFDQIKAHAESLPRRERLNYVQYVRDKRAKYDRDAASEWAETLVAQRYLEDAVLWGDLWMISLSEVRGGPDEAAYLEHLEEYLHRAHDRTRQIRELQHEADEDLQDYLDDRHWDQLLCGVISDLSEMDDDYLTYYLEETIGSERKVTQALEIERANVTTRLFGGRRGPAARHKNEELWENSVTACLGILKCRRDSADPVPEKVSVEEFAREMQPPIDRATWHKHAKFARKPDWTVGITAKEVLKEAYRRLSEESPEG